MLNQLKQSLRHNLVLTLVCLSLLLTACTNKVTTKAEYIYPPQAYTAPCVKTAFTGETYGDVVIQLVKVTAEREVLLRGYPFPRGFGRAVFDSFLTS